MMEKRIEAFELDSGLSVGGGRMVVVAGPCVVESRELCMETALRLQEITQKLDVGYVFKASFDKANRTSNHSFRSLGFDEAMEILQAVRTLTGLPVLTDIHEVWQVKPVAEAASILQIPAFLCRQTDLLVEAGKSGLAVNIKRGQFMAPEDMAYAVEKVISGASGKRVMLTERGVSFGYHNLVVDMRALPIMRQFAPVLFDVTHSVQMPGGQGGSSGGQRQFAPYLGRAAAAAGVDGFFIETHPRPGEALSDGPNMIPLDEMADFLYELKTIFEASRPFIRRLE
jgi:2-dehydro-3-deoxyphosphooctonate aldolase (KDO 8-P synthase)